MTSERTPEDRDFAWVDLPDNCHACLIYDNAPQREAIVGAYLGAGLERGELVRYFTDGTPAEVVQSWIPQGGSAAEPAADGPIRIISAEVAYCPQGRFEPREVIAAMVPGYTRAMAAGFTGVRTCGEMTWALRGIPGSDRLMEYEALINTVPGTLPHYGMCQYDARQFDGATLFRILRVHPYVVAGDQVVWNPYYVGPEVVLAELGQTL
jgi:hypothetical protein